MINTVTIIILIKTNFNFWKWLIFVKKMMWYMYEYNDIPVDQYSDRSKSIKNEIIDSVLFCDNQECTAY